MNGSLSAVRWYRLHTTDAWWSFRKIKCRLWEHITQTNAIHELDGLSILISPMINSSHYRHIFPCQPKTIVSVTEYDGVWEYMTTDENCSFPMFSVTEINKILFSIFCRSFVGRTVQTTVLWFYMHVHELIRCWLLQHRRNDTVTCQLCIFGAIVIDKGMPIIAILVNTC